MPYQDNPNPNTTSSTSTPYGNSQVGRPGAPPPQKYRNSQQGQQQQQQQRPPPQQQQGGGPRPPPPGGRGPGQRPPPGHPPVQRSGAGPPPPGGRGSGRYPTQSQPAGTGAAPPQPPPRSALMTGTDSDDSDDDRDQDRRRRSNTSRYEDEPEDDDGPPQQERQYKYSSANMGRGNCRKYCCIAMLFLLFLGFSIGLSVLIDKVFFSEDDGGTGQPDAYEMPNATFQRDKAYVDTACGASTYDQDGGAKCKEVCEPQYSECCRAFLEENTYANATAMNSSSSAPAEQRTTPETCSLSTETRGCLSYSKCVAAIGMDPAPAALPNYCSEPRLTEDPETCVDICNIHRCCYAQDGVSMNCRADKLDVCLDYAPCQNLRTGPILETAPPNLDQHCFQQTPECDAMCAKAECCNPAHAHSCFQTDFVSCLTYAACSYSPFNNINVTVAPQFSVLPKLPLSIDMACNERHNSLYVQEENPQTCQEICEAAKCCYEEDPATNCFKLDPLGCLAWDQQCQVNQFE